MFAGIRDPDTSDNSYVMRVADTSDPSKFDKIGLTHISHPSGIHVHEGILYVGHYNKKSIES